MTLDATDVAAALAEASDVEGACEAVADALVRHGFDLPSVYLLRGGRLRCYAARGYWQVIDGFAPGVGVIGKVLVSGEPAFLPDVTVRDDFIAAIPGLCGEASVPITLDGDVVGVLSVESRSALPDAALARLGTCATLLADRIAQLGGMPERSPSERLADRVVGLSGTSDAERVLDQLCAAALELSEMSSVAIVRRDAAGGLAISARCGPLADALGALDAGALAAAERWVQHGTSCWFTDGAGSPDHEPFVQAGTGSALILPMTAQGTRDGLMIVADARVVVFEPERVQLLEQLAVHGATTLQSIGTFDELRHMALTDALTDVGNNAAFDRYVDELAGATEPQAVCVVDIDHFKRVNDTLGHVAGDELLCAVAEMLVGAARPLGRVFRIGGDEFVMVVPADDEATAAALGADLCADARAGGRCTVSVGITLTSRVDRSAVAVADAALYEVKRRGRDGYELGRATGGAADRRQTSGGDGTWSVPTSVADEIHEVVFTTDASGRLTFLNRAWDELLGTPSADGVGRVLWEWVHTDDVAACADGFRALLAGDAGTLRAEARWTTATGIRWCELWARPLTTPAGAVIGAAGTLSDITARRAAEDALHRQLTFSTVITRVLERFASLEPGEIDAGIDDALAHVGRFAGVDRSYLFRFSADLTRISNTHEWCADGIAPQIDHLQDVPAEVVDGWMDQFLSGEAVYIPRVSDLEPGELKTTLAEQGIRSLVVVPLVAGTRLTGFLGFDAVREERRWSDLELDLLRTIANALVSLTSRHDVTERLTRQALLDPRTGLPNLATFTACLQQALDDRSGRCDTVAVIVADLGRPQADDDRQHDELLTAVIERASATLRTGDVLARVGTDRLAVVCADLDGPDTARHIAARFADAVRRYAGGRSRPHAVDVAPDAAPGARIGMAVSDAGSTAAGLLRDAAHAAQRRDGATRVTEHPSIDVPQADTG